MSGWSHNNFLSWLWEYRLQWGLIPKNNRIIFHLLVSWSRKISFYNMRGLVLITSKKIINLEIYRYIDSISLGNVWYQPQLISDFDGNNFPVSTDESYVWGREIFSSWVETASNNAPFFTCYVKGVWCRAYCIMSNWSTFQVLF